MHPEEKNFTEYSYSDDTGDAQAVVYHVFPGLEAAFASVHMVDFDFGSFEQGDGKEHVSIHYCREGRIEQAVDQEFFYLMPGDCSIAMEHSGQKMFRLPLKHYHGVSIGIDLSVTRSPLVDYLESWGSAPREALRHICGGRSHIVLRASEDAMRFFEGLYEADPGQRLDHLRAKLPELFYRMKYAKTDRSCYDRNPVPRTQVEFVGAVSDYITENLNEKRFPKCVRHARHQLYPHAENAVRGPGPDPHHPHHRPDRGRIRIRE